VIEATSVQKKKVAVKIQLFCQDKVMEIHQLLKKVILKVKEKWKNLKT
jgi:hypothetical protein